MPPRARRWELDRGALPRVAGAMLGIPLHLAGSTTGASSSAAALPWWASWRFGATAPTGRRSGRFRRAFRTSSTSSPCPRPGGSRLWLEYQVSRSLAETEPPAAPFACSCATSRRPPAPPHRAGHARSALTSFTTTRRASTTFSNSWKPSRRCRHRPAPRERTLSLGQVLAETLELLVREARIANLRDQRADLRRQPRPRQSRRSGRR